MARLPPGAKRRVSETGDGHAEDEHIRDGGIDDDDLSQCKGMP
jgi:hypothetical protein